MKNYIQPGEHIAVAAPADVEAGQFVLVGSVGGVAQETVETGSSVNLIRKGVFELAKTSAQAWTLGAKIYFDAANGVMTTASSGNTLVGAALAAAANPSATGIVLLDGAVR